MLDATASRVYARKGQQPEQPSQSGRKRVNLAGFAIPCRGVCKVYRIERGNADSFIYLLERLAEYRAAQGLGRIVFVVDNARWHHARIVKQWLSEHPGIEILYLSPYSPDFNPIERHWWYMRKHSTHMRLFASHDECWETVNRHFTALTPDQVSLLCQL